MIEQNGRKWYTKSEAMGLLNVGISRWNDLVKRNVVESDGKSMTAYGRGRPYNYYSEESLRRVSGSECRDGTIILFNSDNLDDSYIDPIWDNCDLWYEDDTVLCPPLLYVSMVGQPT